MRSMAAGNDQIGPKQVLQAALPRSIPAQPAS